MSTWGATKACRVLATLLRIGWTMKRGVRIASDTLPRGLADCVFAFHDIEAIGQRMLARIARHTGLRPEGL